MSYQTNIAFNFGTLTGLTLNGKLINSAGVQEGATITSGFVDLGNGNYSYLATIPNGFAGVFIAYKSTDATIDAIVSINPQEDEPGVATTTTTVTNVVAESPATGVYCTRNDIIDIIGEAGLLTCIDDNGNGQEEAGETVFVTRAISRAASEMNHYLGKQYHPLTSLQGNEWLRWCNAYMALYFLQSRRGNSPSASVIENVNNYKMKLDAISWGRENVPAAISTHNSQPAVSNFSIQPNNSDGPVVVDVNRSTGGNPAAGARRNIGLTNFW